MREREREEREYLRHASYGHRHVVQSAVSLAVSLADRIMLCIIIRVLYYLSKTVMLYYYHVTLYGKLYLTYVAYVYNGEIVSLIGNQRVGIFPPKSKILFYLSLALIWCQNFQDGTIPVGGDTWPSCSAERKNNNNNNNNKNKEIKSLERNQKSRRTSSYGFNYG